ncbi:hypothetical protein Mapa_014867 [Marchantia paleacea]|nr:hypothetical protein Mapa_014867 [Marchantia paleacea]
MAAGIGRSSFGPPFTYSRIVQRPPSPPISREGCSIRDTIDGMAYAEVRSASPPVCLLLQTALSGFSRLLISRYSRGGTFQLAAAAATGPLHAPAFLPACLRGWWKILAPLFVGSGVLLRTQSHRPD